MHFGENQLSRSLIGLSPLPTAHPLSFQPKWVRSSTPSYRRFNLAMGRSLRFGSRPSDSHALFGLAFATASPHGLTSPLSTNSQAHSSKGTPSPQLWRLRRIVCTRFQDLFHSPPGVLFTFPSRYLSAIGHQGIFRLSRWSCQIRTGFLGPRTTWEIISGVLIVSATGVSPSMPGPSKPSAYNKNFLLQPSPVELRQSLPQPRTCNAYRLITHARFSLIRFRSPLLTESHVVFSSCGY